MTTPRGSTAGSASGSSTPCSAIPPTHSAPTPPTPALATRTAPKAAAVRKASPATGRAATTPRTSRPCATPPAAAAAQDDRDAGLGYAAPTRTPGEIVEGVGPAGHASGGDAGYDAGDAVSDARRDAGQAGYVDRNDAVRDAGYDARQDAGQAGYVDRNDAAFDDRRGAGRADTTVTTTGPDGGHHHRVGTAGDDRDLVTSSYEPDRDSGYDPQAAGTAMGTGAGAGTAGVIDRDARGGADYDAAGDTGYLDDPRRGGARGYDPTQDTGYVDASRAEADRTTGRRDDDLDTGRVDSGRADLDRDPGNRVPTEPLDTDRDDTHRGVGTAAGAAGAGAVAAAALRHDRSDTDRDLDRTVDRDSDRDARFSAVDDTAAVDSTDTGRSTAETAAAGNGRSDAGIADEDGDGTRERLVPAERAEDYGSRWDALKGDFVDEPRRAVRQADELVGELLDELQRLFADQRRNLEQGFDHDQASTEDLRLALRRYRSFFDRLLSF